MDSDAKFPALPLNAVEEAIFNVACDLPEGPQRAEFLGRACASDAPLRRRIEQLLEAHERAAGFCDDAIPILEAQHPQPTAPLQEAGERIGRYKLLQRIGEGGMGVVYMAEQMEPVRRRVALKIIKLGMDTASVVARFEAERQALALMDHPNIARILDGGATETSRPYFVMELVQGAAITEYCDKNQLPISARIELFLKVCDAVQSAHQKGIIHRDLKPSNIMVTLHDGVPVPKVIDFGVAKATGQELTAKTLFTNYGTLIGTPAYMSPEQAEMSGLDVDTRSDIYSLGALLYELLTGSTPFSEERLRSVGYGEMQRIIAKEEPQRLSTRISTMEGATRSVVARNRAAEAVSLRKRLSGDLDSIVMKCLEKDRTRRYESASAVAADIQRHLRSEPVAARPATAAYQFQKFARRHKAPVTLAALVLIALASAFVISAISYRGQRAAHANSEVSRKAEISERKRAQREASRAEDEALRAARFQYASDMNLAQQAADDGNLFRALQLLNRHRPAASNTTSRLPDLRGWEWRYLWRQCQSEEILTLGVHSNGVSTIGFFPDGKIAFSGGKDNQLRLWDMNAMKQIRAIPHENDVVGAACSPDGRWFASSTENLLQIRELPGFNIIAEHTNTWFRPNNLVFSPDSKLLAYATLLEGLSLWDLNRGEKVAQISTTFGWVASLGLAFSADSQTLAYAEQGWGGIVLWNIPEQRVLRRWQAHEWYIPRLFFGADGRQLYSGSSDRTLKVWDLETLREVRRLNYPLGFGPSRVASPRISADGSMLATASHGGSTAITIQEMPSGQEIRRLRGNTDMVSDFAFAPDGKTLLSGAYNGVVRLWNLSSQTRSHDVIKFAADFKTPNRAGRNVSLSEDGRHLIAAYTNGTFSIREFPSLLESPRLAAPGREFESVAIANGGELAAFVSTNGENREVILWQGPTGSTKLLATRTGAGDRTLFSADAKRLAVGGGGRIDVYDTSSGQLIRRAEIPAPAVYHLGFSADGTKLSAGFFSGEVMYWEIPQPAHAMTFVGNELQCNDAIFLPDGKTLVSAARQIRFWDLKTGQTVFILQPRPAVFRALALSPDGTRLAVGAADGVITIWDMLSMQEVTTLSGHTRPVLEMKFLPDGDTLVSVAVDEIRLWRAASPVDANQAPEK